MPSSLAFAHCINNLSPLVCTIHIACIKLLLHVPVRQLVPDCCTRHISSRSFCLPCSCRQQPMKPNSQLTLTASTLFHIAISCSAGGHTAIGPTPESVRPAVLPPAPAPESVLALKDCEQDVLGLLGWQQMYDPAGYTIHAALPLNCSTETWQAMGCLKSLVNLTLTGQLPDLPDSWAVSGSFPALQTMNFSSSFSCWLVAQHLGYRHSVP